MYYLMQVKRQKETDQETEKLIFFFVVPNLIRTINIIIYRLPNNHFKGLNKNEAKQKECLLSMIDQGFTPFDLKALLDKNLCI